MFAFGLVLMALLGSNVLAETDRPIVQQPPSSYYGLEPECYRVLNESFHMCMKKIEKESGVSLSAMKRISDQAWCQYKINHQRCVAKAGCAKCSRNDAVKAESMIRNAMLSSKWFKLFCKDKVHFKNESLCAAVNDANLPTTKSRPEPDKNKPIGKPEEKPSADKFETEPSNKPDTPADKPADNSAESQDNQKTTLTESTNFDIVPYIAAAVFIVVTIVSGLLIFYFVSKGRTSHKDKKRSRSKSTAKEHKSGIKSGPIRLPSVKKSLLLKSKTVPMPDSLSDSSTLSKSKTIPSN